MIRRDSYSVEFTFAEVVEALLKKSRELGDAVPTLIDDFQLTVNEEQGVIRCTVVGDQPKLRLSENEKDTVYSN